MFAPHVTRAATPTITVRKPVKLACAFDKPQVINIITHTGLKLAFFGVHNNDSKNIGVNVNYSKAKWAITNAQAKTSALHGLDHSLSFALVNTQGQGWTDSLYKDSNGTVVEFTSVPNIETTLETLHRDYTNLGYVVVGTPKVKNKKGEGSNNKGWGMAKLANMRWEQIKELVTRMMLGTGKTFNDLTPTERNTIRERTIMSRADLINKADLYYHLQQLGYVV